MKQNVNHLSMIPYLKFLNGNKSKCLILFGCFFCFSTISAQNEAVPSRDIEIGGFYSFIIDKEFEEEGIFYSGFVSHYINVHLRNQISDKWYIGGEAITAIVTSSEQVDSPFFLFGLHSEYRIITGNKARLFGRLGFSTGDLSYAEPGVPERRFIANIAVGGSLEIIISPGFSLDIGYYNHSPLNRIPKSYGVAMPFLGVHYRILQ